MNAKQKLSFPLLFASFFCSPTYAQSVDWANELLLISEKSSSSSETVGVHPIQSGATLQAISASAKPKATDFPWNQIEKATQPSSYNDSPARKDPLVSQNIFPVQSAVASRKEAAANEPKEAGWQSESRTGKPTGNSKTTVKMSVGSHIARASSAQQDAGEAVENSADSSVQDRLSPRSSIKESLIPVRLRQIEPVTSADLSQPLDDDYTLAEMTGPMTNGAKLLSEVGVVNDFREQTALNQPDIRSVSDDEGQGTVEWMASGYSIISPTFPYQPLYFEQVNLERYGLGPKKGLQPLASSGHFFATIPLLPYKLLAQHPCEDVYTLGYDRPGDCVARQSRPLLGEARLHD